MRHVHISDPVFVLHDGKRCYPFPCCCPPHTSVLDRARDGMKRRVKCHYLSVLLVQRSAVQGSPVMYPPSVHTTAAPRYRCRCMQCASGSLQQLHVSTSRSATVRCGIALYLAASHWIFTPRPPLLCRLLSAPAGSACVTLVLLWALPCRDAARAGRRTQCMRASCGLTCSNSNPQDSSQHARPHERPRPTSARQSVDSSIRANSFMHGRI